MLSVTGDQRAASFHAGMGSAKRWTASGSGVAVLLRLETDVGDSDG